MIKTWYFSYSAFWLTGQWGRAIGLPPLATLLNGTLFPPNSGGDLRSDAHQSQIVGGDADVDHNQIIGGDTIKLLGGYIPLPPPPPGFGIPDYRDGCFSDSWWFFQGNGSVLDRLCWCVYRWSCCSDRTYSWISYKSAICGLRVIRLLLLHTAWCIERLLLLKKFLI